MCILTPYSSTATTLMTLMRQIYPEPSSLVIKNFQNVHIFSIVIDVLFERFCYEKYILAIWFEMTILVQVLQSVRYHTQSKSTTLVTYIHHTMLYHSGETKPVYFLICFFFYYDLGLWSHNLKLNGLRKKSKENHCSVYE